MTQTGKVIFAKYAQVTNNPETWARLGREVKEGRFEISLGNFWVFVLFFLIFGDLDGKEGKVFFFWGGGWGNVLCFLGCFFGISQQPGDLGDGFF